MGMRAAQLIFGIAASTLILAGCKREVVTGGPPPRANDAIEAGKESSTIAVPLDANIAMISAAVEREVPRTLWTINQHIDRCIAPQKIKVLGAKIPVTPKLACDISGTVTRGPIRLHGQGQDLVADVPINAVIRARNVGGVLKETATGQAMAQARIRIDIDGNWNPTAKVDLHYNWTTPPGVDFMGQRILFTDKADEKLRPVVARLERELPRELAKLNLRAQVDQAWRQSFTTLQLNESNPAVWMRVTPQKLSYGGYSLQGRSLQLRLGMEALTETFVGDKPADPAPTALPPMSKLNAPAGKLRFFMPVIADYAILEPVILKALVKRSARPFDVPGLDPVIARFDKVVAYGTTGGRVAVGLTLVATPQAGGAPTSGTVWLTALPLNEANTRTVRFTDLAVTGETNAKTANLLLTLVNTPGVAGTVAESLTQNFDKDFNELIGKVQKAIVNKRTGDFVIRAHVDGIESGSLRAAGQGLYLPVWVNGRARVEFRPH